INTYTTPGFSCDVGPMTFENRVASLDITLFEGSATFTGTAPVVPFTSDNEFGLTWTYSTTISGSGFIDVGLTYDVLGALGIGDALLAFNGSAVADGHRVGDIEQREQPHPHCARHDDDCIRSGFYP